MGSTFKSGAFLKQCFEVHPNDVQCERFEPSSTLVFFCRQCDISSRATLPEGAGNDEGIKRFLERCASSHPQALRLQAMAIETDELRLFCNTCRASHRLAPLSFESTLAD
jgi:hypothetical protein